MDKEEFAQPDADSYEFISRRDASITSDSCSSTDSGIPLSCSEKALADRVRILQQENKEIRSAIDNYQKALQLCQESLNNVIDREGVILGVAQEKYNQAKSKVEKQNATILSLEIQLEEEKNKHSNHGKAIPDENQQSQKPDCKELEVPEKDSFKDKACSLHEFVGTLSGLTPDECKASISPDLLQDLIKLSTEMEKYIKPLFESDSTSLGEKHALEEELEFVKEQLKLGEQRTAELETRNSELQDFIESTKRGEIDLQEVQDGMKLLHKDMEKIDMIRAGCVSHSSQTTEESLSLNLPGQQQSVDNSLILKLETEIRELKKQVQVEREEKKKLNSGITKRENTFLSEKDNILAQKESLQQKLEELKAKFDEKTADESELQEAVEENFKITEELKAQNVKYSTMEKELLQRISINEEKEEKLIEKNSELVVELKKKEDIENELKAQVCSFCQEIEQKELQCDDLNERLYITKTESEKMNSALEEMRRELNLVYAQNEKLLTERKSASEVELIELQSKIDNLTAQLLSAEEMLEHKENDLRKLLDEKKGLASELETVPLLKQQLDLFQADFNTERQTRQKVEDDNRKLRDEVVKMQAENERLIEASDPTAGSKLAEMQRRHGCRSMQVGGANDNPWSGFYDQFLAPRGPGVPRNSPQQPSHESDINRQVSGGRCPKCDVMFPDLDTLQTHVVGCLESESTGSVGGKICPKCQGSFPDLDTLQIHVMECLDD